MATNKTQPTNVSVQKFLESVTEQRQNESHVLIDMFRKITGQEPIVWGPSIIGFGNYHYKLESGREGDMPICGFSPRKASITIYIPEGFDRHYDALQKLGTHKTSVSCLYIKKLSDIDLDVLSKIMKSSFLELSAPRKKPETVDEYVRQVPPSARPQFDQLRTHVQNLLPDCEEVLSYGIVGYRSPKKRMVLYISGWKDHLAIYPIPKDPLLAEQLTPHIKGKGSLWFKLDEPLPKVLITSIVSAHLSAANKR